MATGRGTEDASLGETEEPMSVAFYLQTDPASLKLGDVVDGYKALNELRLAMQKEVDAVEAAEKQYRQHIVDNLAKSNEAGVFGLRYKATIKTKRAFQVDTQAPDGGWDRVWGYIAETGNFGILQKRLNDRAMAEMYEAGELPPGVNSLLVPEISVTKIS